MTLRNQDSTNPYRPRSVMGQSPGASHLTAGASCRGLRTAMEFNRQSGFGRQERVATGSVSDHRHRTNSVQNPNGQSRTGKTIVHGPVCDCYRKHQIGRRSMSVQSRNARLQQRAIGIPKTRYPGTNRPASHHMPATARAASPPPDSIMDS